MRILAYVIWGVAALVVAAWNFDLRGHMRSGMPVPRGLIVQSMVSTVAVLLVPILRVSPFHLLWAFTLGVVLGVLSL